MVNMNLFMIWGIHKKMNNSQMLLVIEIVLAFSLAFQVAYLVFVYRALKRMSGDINKMTDILVTQAEEKKKRIRKTSIIGGGG